ncbi:hypothetical protein [Paenibacillus sp. FSL H7-0331]|uniref:hypothetical protein n=1 Tax=Paenibacillus sp. FSL H7-0331 TaxID=1920421 RepID=UPI0015C323F6|nr:hypothetical protein [Paenibacillus sp. FSL H7-0331]
MKYKVGNEMANEDVYEVCEVYYENGEPNSFIKDKNPYNQDSVEDIRRAHEKVASAFEKPVLLWDEIKLNEIE